MTIKGHANVTTSVLAEQTLDQLAEIIIGEDAAARGSAETMVLHAIRAGEALTEAFRRVEPGKWEAWVNEWSGLSTRTVAMYRRVAHYQQEVLGARAGSLSEAIKILSPYPKLNANGPVSPWNAQPQHVREEARRLHAEGFTHQEIADELQVAAVTIGKWLDPEYLERRRVYRSRKRADVRAAKEAVAPVGRDDMGKVYALVRQTAATIERVVPQCVSTGDAVALRATLLHLRQVEAVVRRLLLQGQDGAA